MLFKLFPTVHAKSIFHIDYEVIKSLGYQAIIFDIDATLVPHGADTTDEIDALFYSIHELGLQTLLLSNNSDERIKHFNRNIQTKYIPMANKPDSKGYIKAIQTLAVPKHQILVIGDQIFTDIVGANQCGLDTIIVDYLLHEGETKIGKKRRVEQVLLQLFALKPTSSELQKAIKQDRKVRQPLSERYPILYNVATKKETIKRHVQDVKQRQNFAMTKQDNTLPHVVHQETSYLIKKGKGIDPVLQKNKADNIALSASKMDRIIIHPGEHFSFWKLVGKITKKAGYKDGRVIVNNEVVSGMGGGLCNLANTLHLLVVHSPLEITEFHTHSDALAPDQGERKPFQNGTSVSYNYVDYRFKNITDQNMQVCFHVKDETLYAELRSERPFPWRYRLVEENHRFVKKNGKYYRKSKIYKITENEKTGQMIDKQLLLDNHSEVMFDYDLIPQSLIQPE